MKRIVAVLVMLCMIFPFVACGEKTPSETGEKIALLETADKKFKFFFVKPSDVAFRP